MMRKFRELIRRLFWRAPLAFACLAVLVALPAAAQVAGICSAGKNCTVRTLRAGSGATTSLSAGDVVASRIISNSAVQSTSFALGNGSQIFYCDSASQCFAGYFTASSRVSASDYMAAGTGYAASATFASFPSCTGGMTGRLLYDSTNNVWRFCDGGYWRPLQSSSEPTYTYASAGFSSVCFGTCSTESSNFTGSYSPRSDNERGTQKISCSWGTAGTGGTTGVVVRIYNGSAEVCSCTLGACTTAANTALSCACAAGLLASSKNYTVQLKSTTDCTANPGNIVCNVE